MCYSDRTLNIEINRVQSVGQILNYTTQRNLRMEKEEEELMTLEEKNYVAIEGHYQVEVANYLV